MEITWCNGLCPGRRYPRLYLAKGDEVRKFEGKNLDGFCAIKTSEFELAGKWSNTTYALALAPGVRPITFLSPLHGTWGDNLGSWAEVAETLGLSIETARTIVRAEYPRTAERLDKYEAFANQIDQDGGDTEIVVFVFGSPANKFRQQFWSEPKSRQTSDGRTVTIAPSPDDPIRHGWYKPLLVEPADAQILDVRHSPGHHGGSFTIRVAVPIGGDRDGNVD